MSAHRRDEYLQAARVDIASGIVHVDLDLTPGIALADAVIGEIDRNRDGSFSPDEQRDYGRVVLEALTLEIDGTRIRPGVLGSTFPGIEAMRRGEGSIRIRLAGSLPRLSPGAHQLLLRNLHSPERSVYLANALAPRGTDIEITAQRRDTNQTELTIDYLLRGEPARPASGWMLGGLTALLALSALVLRTLGIAKTSPAR
jgi:hypothetical protein